jgi:hypothetical protein
MDWRQYQHEAAEFFQSLDCKVAIEAKIAGARAEHKIDVWVLFSMFGLETKWVIECKNWNSPVPKEKVLALKSIVEDVGADRGILISTAGFQSGAVHAAEMTNITLTDLDSLKETAHDDLIQSVIHRIETRVIELTHDLFGLRIYESTGPNSGTIRSLPGVDGEAVLRMIGRLSLLRNGFDQVRLKKPPYPITFDDANKRQLVASTVEDFVAAATKIVDEAKLCLNEQRQAADRAARQGQA